MFSATRTITRNTIQYDPLHKDAKRVTDPSAYTKTIIDQVIDFGIPHVFRTKNLKWESIFSEAAATSTGYRVVDVTSHNRKAYIVAENGTKMRLLTGTSSLSSTTFGLRVLPNQLPASPQPLIGRRYIVSYSGNIHVIGGKATAQTPDGPTDHCSVYYTDALTEKYSPPANNRGENSLYSGNNILWWNYRIALGDQRLKLAQDDGAQWSQVSGVNILTTNVALKDGIYAFNQNYIFYQTQLCSRWDGSTLQTGNIYPSGSTLIQNSAEVWGAKSLIFIGTDKGIYSLGDGSPNSIKASLISGTDTNSWSVLRLSPSGTLGGDGLYALRSNADLWLSTNGTSFNLLIAAPSDVTTAEGFGFADGTIYMGGWDGSKHHVYRLVED